MLEPCEVTPFQASVLNLHPCSLLRTLDHCVENAQLANPILEGGIFNRRLTIGNSPVEAAEDLLEGVIIAFAVAARQVGVTLGPICQVAKDL